jgi:lysophospholipase L1-like esterase
LEQSAKVDLSRHLQRSQVLPLALFQALAQRAKAAAASQGAGFGVVLLPGRGFVQDPDGIAAQYQNHLRHMIIAWGTEAVVPVADAATELRRRYRDGIAGDYYQNEGHLTAQGHRAVADFLAPWIGLQFKQVGKTGKNSSG